MSLLFLDTSALIKLYIDELGSTWLRNYITGQQVVISELALYESATVLRRRFLEGGITQVDANSIYSDIRKASEQFTVIQLRVNNQLQRVVDLALSELGKLRLRALDSIHLVAAQVAQETARSNTPAQPFIFLSSDVQLLRIAQFLGLSTDNPESYA